MFISDLPFILTWWLVFLLVGIVFLPLTMLVFSHFVDRGYIFSKILGMLLVGYTVFALGTFKILPFFQGSITFLLVAWGGVSLFLLWKNREEFVETLQKGWKLFLFEEILFFIALSFWSYVRAHEPSIHGLEKYMDFGFVNSVLRGDFFPAKDLWLTPFSINYYYFGHIVTAVLTKLSGIDPVITYNLMIATLFAFTFTGAFSIGLNLFSNVILNSFQDLKKRGFRNEFGMTGRTVAVVAGLLSGLLVALAGNLHTIYSFFAAYDGENPVPFWTLGLDWNLTNYWYPNATRFIPLTIHEFPIYSFVVSDLHGHVLSIPIVLTIIAVLWSLIISKSEARNPKQDSGQARMTSFWGAKRLQNQFRYSIFDIRILLISFLLAVAYTTNAWDGLIYFLLVALVFLYLWRKQLVKYLTLVILVFIGSILFSLPFSLHFKPFVSGIGIICVPEFLTKLGKLGPFLFEADHCQRSPLWQLIILHGFWYFWIISFLALLLRIGNWKLEIGNWRSSDVFVLILIALSTLLLVLPEFVYAKDIYPAHYRANTMFKLGYEAFMMLGIACAYIIVRLISNIKYEISKIQMKYKHSLNFSQSSKYKILNFYYVYLLFAFLFFILVMIYPYFAINSYYGELKTYRGLDGLAYLRDLYPTDYEGILWLRDNIKGQPVILEAAGESYTDYARVSANTGLPTVVGWPVHEWLWRGTYDEAGKRVSEVEKLYTATDITEARQLLEKYNVEYIFVGALERQKYPALREETFKTLGTPIYQNGETVIYKVIN